MRDLIHLIDHPRRMGDPGTDMSKEPISEVGRDLLFDRHVRGVQVDEPAQRDSMSRSPPYQRRPNRSGSTVEPFTPVGWFNAYDPCTIEISSAASDEPRSEPQRFKDHRRQDYAERLTDIPVPRRVATSSEPLPRVIR